MKRGIRNRRKSKSMRKKEANIYDQGHDDVCDDGHNDRDEYGHEHRQTR